MIDMHAPWSVEVLKTRMVLTRIARREPAAAGAPR